MRTYQSQLIDVPVVGGVDQASDPVLAKGLLELVNARYTRENSLSKRDGISQLSTSSTTCRSEYVADSFASPVSRAAGSLEPDAVLPTGQHAVFGDHVYRYSASGSRWDGVGLSSRLVADTTEVGVSCSGQANVAVSTDQTYYCVVYGQLFLDASATGTSPSFPGTAIRLVWEIRSFSDDTLLFRGTAYPSSASARAAAVTNPHVHWDNTSQVFHIGYIETSGAGPTSDVKLFNVSPVSGITSSATTIIAGYSANILNRDWSQNLGGLFSMTGKANAVFMVVSGGGTAGVAYRSVWNGVSYTTTSINVGTARSGTSLKAVHITYSPLADRVSVAALIDVVSLEIDQYVFSDTLTGLTQNTVSGFTISTSVSVRPAIAHAEIASGNRWFIVSSAGYDLESVADLTDGVSSIVSWEGFWYPLSTPFVYKDSASTTVSNYVGANIVCAIGTGQPLAGYPFTDRRNDIASVRFEWKGTTDAVRTCQLFPLAYGNSTLMQGVNHVATTNVVGTKVALALVPFISTQDVSSSSNPVPVNMTRIDLAFTGRRIVASGFGGLHLISGGVPSMFDGKATIELGSMASPCVLFAVGGTGNLDAGSRYSYVASSKVISPSGLAIRSAISSVVNVAMGSATALSVIVYPRDSYDNMRLPGCIYSTEIWRSSSDGSSYYKVTEISDVPNALFSLINGSLSFTDKYADATIEVNEQLQVPNGATSFEPVQPPSAKGAWYAGQRYWLTETPDGSAYYSQVVVGREAPIFNPALRVPITETGKVIAVVDLDRSTILLTERGVYTVAFEGDDTIVQAIQSPSGCTNRYSVVKSSMGVYFAGYDCLYFLDRSLSVKRADDALEYLSDTSQIVASTYNSRYDEAVFALEGASSTTIDCLVCNETRDNQQWCKFQYTRASGEGGQFNSLTFEPNSGVLYALNSHGSIMKEVPGQYVDDTSGGTDRRWITMSFRTPWVSPAGVQGYMRTWRAGVKFTNFGATNTDVDLTVSVYQDQSDTPTVQTKTFTSVGNTTQFRDARAMLRLRRQKCHALSVRCEDAAPGGALLPANTGQGVRIQAVTMELQVQGGSHGLARGQRG